MTKTLPVLVGAAAVILTTAAVASVYAVGCRGQTCEGRDSQQMGCGADARTIRDCTIGGDRIELRYSPRCNAMWTRLTMASPSYSTSEHAALIRVNASPTNERAKKIGQGVYDGETEWSPMLSHGRLTQGRYAEACVYNPALPAQYEVRCCNRWKG